MNKSPCTYDPKEMAGKPIGMFHCPECGEMVLAGMDHPPYWLEECIHEYGNEILLSMPAKQRCVKCGYLKTL
jgi:predicted RNA-binding Zn-ribbon protein involved in translation (DUF1610 family)